MLLACFQSACCSETSSPPQRSSSVGLLHEELKCDDDTEKLRQYLLKGEIFFYFSNRCCYVKTNLIYEYNILVQYHRTHMNSCTLKQFLVLVHRLCH